MAAESVVEDSIDSAVQIAEKAAMKKEAEKASMAWAQAAIIAVGSGVATTARKIQLASIRTGLSFLSISQPRMHQF